MTQTNEEDGDLIDVSKGRIFPCEGCGADLEFHIGKQSMQCPYCGFTKQITLSEDAKVSEQNYEEMLDKISNWRREKADELEDTGEREVKCESCGFEVVFLGSLTSTTCACCGSPIQQDKSVVSRKRIPVDGVLAFGVTRDRAQKNLKSWVKSRWFAPNQFKKYGIQGRFSGIYLPYWTYDSLSFSHYAGKRGEYYWVTQGSGKDQRRVRKNRWHSASGSFQRFFDDVLVCAAHGLPDDLIDSLAPWPLRQCQPYNQEVIAGYAAKTYEVGLKSGFREAKGEMSDLILKEVKRRIGGDVQRVSHVETHFDSVSYKHLLLPLWLMGYKYKKKNYQVLVNARTGEVQGHRPLSYVKIFLLVLLVAAIIAAIVHFTQQSQMH